MLTSTHLPDQDDDALNRWKASLGLGQGESISDPNDPRRCIIKSLALVSLHLSSRVLCRAHRLWLHRKSMAVLTSVSMSLALAQLKSSARSPSPSKKAVNTR